MKLQLLPVFVLPLVSGFASVPATETECFFMYSVDPSLSYMLANALAGTITPPGPFAVPPPFPDLVGKVWEGVVLTIQGPETETVTLETVTGQSPPVWYAADLTKIAVMSEEFCLPHGTYSVNLTTPTASTLKQRTSNDCNIEAALKVNTSYMWAPEWAIFPANLRDEAVAVLQALVVGLPTFDTTAILTGVGWAGSKDDDKVQISNVGDCYGRNLIVPSTPYNERNAAVLAAEAATLAALNTTCVPYYGYTSQDGRRRRLADDVAECASDTTP